MSEMPQEILERNASKSTRVRSQERQHDPGSPTGNTVVVWPLGSASSPSRSSRHSPQPSGVDEAPTGTNNALNNAVVSSIDALDPDIVIPNAQEIPVAPNPESSAQADLGSLDQQTTSLTPSHGARQSEKSPLSHEIQNPATLGRSKLTPRVGQEDGEMQALFSFSYPMPPISENSIAGHEISNSLAHSQAEPDALMSNNADSAAHLSFPEETQPATTFRRDSLHGHDTSALSDQGLGNLLGQYADRTWPPAEPDWLPGLDAELTMPNLDWHSWGNNPLLSFDVTAPLDHPIKRRRKTASFTSEIPDERFAEMAQLWPKRGDQPWQLMQTLWSDSVSHRCSNIFSDTEHADNSYVAAGPKSAEGRLDDQRRISMSQEYGVECPSVVIPAQKGLKIRFPTLDMLEICIEIYFHRFHPLMPFVHKPTFSPKHSPNMIVFPICLIGLFHLDPARTRGFVARHLSKVMGNCNTILSKPWSRSDSRSLLAVLASSTLALSCAAALEERVHSEQTHALYSKVLSVAQQNGLFEAGKGQPLASVLPQGRSDDLAWKAWARVESTKRLIACLIMVDSFFSSGMRSHPIIRLDTMRFYTPCSTALFEAPDAIRWAQLDSTGQCMKPSMLNLRPHQISLPADVPSSSIGLYSLLSAVWLRLTDVKYRLSLQDPTPTILIPGELYQKDEAGALLVPLLRDIYTAYKADLVRSNPNNVLFWHVMCISITTNMDILEIAAGREGIHAGKEALERIAGWAQSPSARRACLHAAHIYAAMSRRKVSDGTTFLSEDAIFNAALVLGLYLLVGPDSLQEDGKTAPFELLDDVDWSELAEEGFAGYMSSSSNIAKSSPAVRFVSMGGPVSFSSMALPGGLNSARRVLVDFVSLLEEVGKWKAGKLCHILRLMSDSVTDL
ncbi:hypothetical protein CDV36_009614 [Fusarium kuroshium]|uniref:Xylanolytic transcriptional activator regulatory domain-containing protein n=1 Tax=Fusarium kuroshium TaxID=2010991 RepID=A0A3M2RZM5_9HYPO|nr:hypothetical protein CDV36_009614 [Fusarium kuroshium]